MHPYESLPSSHFWSRSVAGKPLDEVDYDPSPKFRFDLASDLFATAGSCFAQHFGRQLVERGGRLLIGEPRHPAVPEQFGHGYGVFSARYGNLYNTAQLKELIEQAVGERDPIMEFALRDDERWVDMLRPRAIPDGFSSVEEAEADRRFHLRSVRRLLEECSVFVFTLGLTESWHNKVDDYSYGICPGVIAGSFDAEKHAFVNFSVDACVRDLASAFSMMRTINPSIRILLTVSPVMLVATAEPRGVLQSSLVSKAILRAAADQCVRDFGYVDYFPSFEIIAGPQARGRFFDDSSRDVGEEGVRLVMDVFFRSRMVGSARDPVAPAAQSAPYESEMEKLRAALQAECDEILLDAGSKEDSR